LDLGGSAGFQRGKVFMYGGIAGDLFGAITFMAVGYGYFFTQQVIPPR